MIPVLYSANETAFNTNGIGKLTNAIDCTVIEVLNSKFEIELIYPVMGIHFKDIQHRCIIMVEPDPETDPQPFRIYRITKPIDGQVMIYARHLVYDLIGITVVPFSAATAAMALKAIKANAVNDCPFNFSTNLDVTETMTIEVPTQIWTVLGSSKGQMLEIYGGEYEFDRYNIKLLKQRGSDRGVSVRYGKNLTSLEQDENCANCYTAVHPYWKSSDGNLVQLSEKTVAASGNYGYTRIMPLDCSDVWDKAPTEAQLRKYTQQYIADNKIGIPQTSLKIGFVQLEQTDEYKGKALFENVQLGDTISVEYEELGVSAAARVNEVRYKPLLGRYESISVGDVKANLAGTIASKPSQSQVKTYAACAAQKAVDAQTQQDIFDKLTDHGRIQGIYSENGKWYINAEVAQIINLMADTISTGILDADKVTIKNFVADVIKSGNLDASKVNIKNLVADVISSGTLDAKKVTIKNLVANLISAGILQSTDKKTYFNLDTGEFESVGPSGEIVSITGGNFILKNSSGVNQIMILRNNDQNCIWFFNSKGAFIGGIGSLEDRFLVFAPDEDNEGQIIGFPTAWKTVNGVKTLITHS